MITYVKRNIFAMNVEAIVNTVNCKGAFGKGLAYQFHLQYPASTQKYKTACHNHTLKIGTVLLVDQTNETLPNLRFVVHFPTKDDWRNPSELSYIRSGCRALRESVIDHNIKSIAIPPLGCGLGRLKWGDVRSIIEAELKDLDCIVYIIEP